MILYLLKTVLCSGIMLLAYYLLLQREKMLWFCRFYLLFSLVFSFAIPLVHFSVLSAILLKPQVIATLPDTNILINAIPENAPVTTSLLHENAAFDWWNFVAAIYVSGCLIMLVRYGKNLYRLILVIRNNKVQNHSGAKLVLLNKPTVPHSFFHFIFLNKEDYNDGLIQPEVLCHEQTHVQQKHSFDIVFIELLLVFFWFNPALYFYRKAIRLNHEFLADEAVIKRFEDAPAYQQLLLQTATALLQPYPASSFTYSITKKRFLMMTKNTSTTVLLIKGAILSSLIVATVFIFSTRTVAQVKDSTKKERQQGSTATNNKNQPQAEKDDEILGKDPWIRQSVGHTKEGIASEQLQEYNAIIEKYMTEGKWWETFSTRISTTDRNRLESIFKQMSFAQQSGQFLIFFKPFAYPSKVVPAKAQFETFKNPKVYGLWIDGKHVNNAVLNNYSNTDFSHVYISKLYGAAKTGKSYTHQLNLETNDHYDAEYKESLSTQKNRIAFVMNNHPADSIRRKYRFINGKPGVHVQMYSNLNEKLPVQNAIQKEV